MSFKKLIENKHVLILGPADYLYSSRDNLDLMNFEVIVKINRMPEMDTSNIFKNDRCDILYHSLSIHPPTGDLQYDQNIWIRKKIKHIRAAYPPVGHKKWYADNINKFLRTKDDRIEFSIVQPEDYLNFEKQCNNTSPNSGTIAILDILLNNPKTVTVKGITMFCGGYNKNYKDKFITEKDCYTLHSTVKNHSIYHQSVLLKKIFLENNKINADEEMIECLQKNINKGAEW